MKNVLLTTTALVAFAGAAAAEVSFSGSAEVGYNDEYVDGAYASGDMTISMSQELNNGIVATLSYGLTFDEDDQDGDDFPTITLESAYGTLSAGDVEFAAVDHFSGVSGMDADAAWENDGDPVFRLDTSFGGIDASVSAEHDDNDLEDGDELDDVSFGASGTFGSVSFGLGYESFDWNGHEFMGINAGTSFSGVDVDVAYASHSDDAGATTTDSIGVAVSAEVGGAVLSGYYASNDGNSTDQNYGVAADFNAGMANVGVWFDGGDQGEDFGIDVSAEAGEGVMVYAGYADVDNTMYLGATYDLGAGAEIGVSYASDDAGGATEEIGPNDYYEGISLWASMSF